MRNSITIDGKIGYLNLRTGKYKWVTIIGFTESGGIRMREIIGKYWANHYEERTEDVIKYLKTPSIDFSDGRPVMKYKGTTRNYAI